MSRSSMEGNAGPGRLSGGFSLDEAARLYGMLRPGIPVTCPSCGGVVSGVSGAWLSARVQVIRCETCGRGLVFDRPVRHP